MNISPWGSVFKKEAPLWDTIIHSENSYGAKFLMSCLLKSIRLEKFIATLHPDRHDRDYKARTAIGASFGIKTLIRQAKSDTGHTRKKSSTRSITETLNATPCRFPYMQKTMRKRESSIFFIYNF